MTTENYLRQSAHATDQMLEFNTVLFKKLAELRKKYGVTTNNSIDGEIIIEFPEGTPSEAVEVVMKELYEVKMG